MSAHPQDDLLAAYVDGSLPASQREAVDAHLQACPQCRAEIDLARTAHTTLRAMSPELDPPIDVASAVLEAATGRHAPAARAGSPPAARAGSPPAAAERLASAPRWYRAATVAAAAAVIVLAVYAIPQLGGGSDDRGTAAGRPEAAADASAERAEFGYLVQTREYDDVSLAALAAQDAQTLGSDRRAALSDQAGSENTATAPTAGGFQADAGKAEVAACIRAGASETVPPEAPLLRVIAARFEGSDAYLGTFALGPAGAPTAAIIVVVSREHCAFLGSAEHGI